MHETHERPEPVQAAETDTLLDPQTLQPTLQALESAIGQVQQDMDYASQLAAGFGERVMQSLNSIEEVRSLAQRANESSTQIMQIASSLQGTAENARAGIGELGGSATQALQQAQLALAAMGEIREGAQARLAIVNRVIQGLEQQSRISGELQAQVRLR